eukprot:TRINITY_DN60242_c0_g1_i1.p1 TRINITY_DN60242_c0_g1~~TRINITY_DN60242_c0_g1_i1.p1  ORF type:complete len:471 (+),score=83.74 TRINITY_DN60242_c0_g1_i1:53-1465(+)
MGCGAGKSSVVDHDTAVVPFRPEEAGSSPVASKGSSLVASKSGTVASSKRPSLAELRKQNVVGPDEAIGVKKACAGDKHSADGLRSGASCLNILESRSVLVAVRARPLNSKETAAASPECLDFRDEQGLTIRREGDRDVEFAFDCVMRPGTAQQEVFDRTARPLLHKVLEGYNGCLFAYGQTGSGKTFTMQGEGTGENCGLIPKLCSELFSAIQVISGTKNVTVVCSVLEIYNEHVRDLLADGGEDLAIREDSGVGGSGIHVDGLLEVAVKSADEVLANILKAQAKRAVGKTNMNEHSSRSHSVVTLRIAASDVDDIDGVTLTVSKFHLIDLAGSERQKATGATGDRLKEGAQINLSLSALGNVISALTDSAKRHVPYRDSKLTRLLQDSLGGNSYTVMICNVSPAKINAEETLSSLRFAERAKKIENKAVVNRDPKGERIVELMQENKMLKAKCQRLEAYVALLEKHYE